MKSADTEKIITMEAANKKEQVWQGKLSQIEKVCINTARLCMYLH